MVGGSVARPWERERLTYELSVSQNRTGLSSVVTAEQQQPSHSTESSKNILSAPSSHFSFSPARTAWVRCNTSAVFSVCVTFSSITQSSWSSSRKTMMSSSSKLFPSLLLLQKCFTLTTCSATNYKPPGNAEWLGCLSSVISYSFILLSRSLQSSQSQKTVLCSHLRDGN